jgi:hypothetical protein
VMAAGADARPLRIPALFMTEWGERARR